MLIRSQDKCFLGEYKEIYIVDASIMGASGAVDDSKLGDYETHEEALEVLDAIEDHMKAKTEIYYMPEEKGGNAGE